MTIFIQDKCMEDAESKRHTGFFHCLSHELRTPLHGILGLAELLEETKLTSEQACLVQTIKSSGRGLVSLLNNVLEMAKIGTSRFKPHSETIDLYDLVQCTMEALAFAISSKVELVLDIQTPPEYQYVITDRQCLQTVLFNIIGNAVKFTHEGSIVVTFSLAAQNEAIARVFPGTTETRDSSSSRDRIYFTVSDTGIGIAQEFRDRLFRPFTQQSSFTSGVGLGLATTKQLVEALGGSITFVSPPQSGSSFVFYIEIERSTSAELQVTAGLPAHEKNLYYSTSTFKVADLFPKDDGRSNGHALPSMVFVSTPKNPLNDILERCFARSWQYPMKTVCLGGDGLSDDALTEAKSADILVINEQLTCLKTVCSAFETSRTTGATEAPSSPIQKLPKPRIIYLLSVRKYTEAARYASDPHRRVDVRLLAKPVHQYALLAAVQAMTSTTPNTIPAAAPVPSMPPMVNEVEESAQRGRSPANESSIPEKKDNGATVLIVEDNPTNAMILNTLIKRMKLRALNAVNGLLGVQEFIKMPLSGPRIVLCDIQMPEMDGHEAIALMRSHELKDSLDPALILAVTGLSDPEVQKKAMSSGADVFITKPVSLRQLTGILNRYLQKAWQD